MELLLTNSSALAYIQDNEGLFPVHIAAITGNVNAVLKFTEICLDYDELLDNKRRNILHCAVEHGKVMLVRHICGNPKFLRMMNARDGEGNTPLHLSVKHGHAMIFLFLMVDPRVNLDIMNNEGSTPLDVASSKIQSDDTLSLVSSSIDRAFTCSFNILF
jgi:ankyrin repeat protein